MVIYVRTVKKRWDKRSSTSGIPCDLHPGQSDPLQLGNCTPVTCRLLFATSSWRFSKVF